MKKKNYEIEIDIEKALLDSGMIDEYFYIQDINHRKLFLNVDIDQSSVASIVRNIMQFNAEDSEIEPSERTPIMLYLTSFGGDVKSGFELIDVIEASQTPVYTINLGYQYSMGFLIGLAGHKRFTTKNSTFLMHDGSDFICNSGAKAQDEMEFNKRITERVKKYVLSHSRLTEEEYDSKLRVEWYLFADEAKEKGFTDYIIGEDCGLGEII